MRFWGHDMNFLLTSRGPSGISAGCNGDALQSGGSIDARQSHGVSDSRAEILRGKRPKPFSRTTRFCETVASDAACLEHVTVFLFKPESPFRSDRSDCFGSGRLQSASWESVHGNRGSQCEHAQEPGRRGGGRVRGAKRIFQTAGRSADEQLTFRRRRYRLVARSQFGTHCCRNSSDHLRSSIRPDPALSVPELLKLRQAMSGVQDKCLQPGEKSRVGQDHRRMSRPCAVESCRQRLKRSRQTDRDNQAGGHQSLERSAYTAGSTISQQRRHDED